MKTQIIFLFLIMNFLLFPQNDMFEFDSFKVSVEGSKITAFDSENSEIFNRIFNYPSVGVSDLDEDGLNELIVMDSLLINEYSYYTFYVFNTIDSFYLADSIYSGRTQVYQIHESEAGGTSIVSGFSKFDHFNQSSTDFFTPINVWKYDSGRLLLINDEMYDIFLNENEIIVEYLDGYFALHDSNCLESRKAMGAITAGFANYYNAGETSLAVNFLKKYYFCEDLNKLQQELIQQINKENFNENGME